MNEPPGARMRVGLSALTINSPIKNKLKVDYITERKGGDGAFREFDDLILTDESSLMEKLGYKIMIVPGNGKNFKITTFDDWKRAEAELQ